MEKARHKLIEQFVTGVAADTFLITRVETDCWIMQRVYGFAVLEPTENGWQECAPLTCRGIERSGYENGWLVQGADKNENGRTWLDVWHGAPVWLLSARDISQEIKALPEFEKLKHC